MMADTLTLEMIYAPSNDIVAREIEGELIIVPIASGIGDMEDELFTLNDTGKAIWGKLDGIRTLKQIATELANEYNTPTSEIERDVVGLIDELTRRKILVMR
jgi:hypothetical protein